MLKLSICFLVVFAIGALASDEPDRIVGGQQARRGQFPHQVSLRRNTTRAHFCGGSIIHERFVLSAAHCTQNAFSMPANVQIAVGAHHRANGGILHTVLRIINHPRFNRRRMENDICVIQTTTPIRFGQYVRAIKLPSTNLPDENNLPLTVSGWGQYRAGPPSIEAGHHPEFLQFKDTNSLARPDCVRRLGWSGASVHLNTICTNNPVAQGLCIGDSGGPLITNRNVLVGIVSWGLAPCGRGMPDVYARVFSHMAFINEIIKN